MAARMSKRERQQRLKWLLAEDPFRTDEELARCLNVSVQTIRLDRLELNLPQVRERTKQMAAQAYAKLRTLSGGDVVGVLVALDLGRQAKSRLETVAGMGFTHSSIVRGHFLFAQANSLAVAVINAPFAVTAAAEIKFIRPVHIGDVVEASAKVNRQDGRRFYVDVNSYVHDRRVFTGEFQIAALEEEP